MALIEKVVMWFISKRKKQQNSIAVKKEITLNPGKLRSLRFERGKTLDEASKGIGISISYLSELERDTATPSLGVLGNIADYYDVIILISPQKSDG